MPKQKTKPCTLCEYSTQQPNTGTYDLTSPQCAVRYLASVYPPPNATADYVRTARMLYKRHKATIEEVIKRHRLRINIKDVEAQAKLLNERK